MLAEFDADLAARLAAGSGYAMLRFDGFPVMTVVVIMMHLAMRGWIFRRVGVVGRDLSHSASPLFDRRRCAVAREQYHNLRSGS